MPASVAIVIPCFNHNEAVKKAIQSLHDLSIPPSQVVVIDDGSDVPVDVTSVSSGLNLTVVRTRNQGLAAARNEGLKRVSSDWVIFLDSDDVLHANALDFSLSISPSRQVSVVQRGYMLCRGEFSDPVFPAIGNISTALLQGNLGPPHSFVFARSALNEIGGFNTAEVLRHGHEDFDLITRLSLAGARFITQHVIVADYFKYDGSMSSFTENMARTRAWVWHQYFISVTIDSANALLAATRFFANHFADFQRFWPDCIEEIAQILKAKLSTIPVHPAELEYAIQSLPVDVRRSLLATPLKSTTSIAKVANEVFDWRAQHYPAAILLRRISKLSTYAAEAKCDSVVIWGMNELAEQAIAILQLSLSVTVVDSSRAGDMLSGNPILAPEKLNFSGDWPILITAHQAFSSIAAQLAAMNVETKRIF